MDSKLGDDERTTTDRPAQDKWEREVEAYQPMPFWREVIEFAIHNKKWWMIPILLSLAVLGLLAWLSTTAVGPFIYTLY
jgi:hypothetical protein